MQGYLRQPRSIVCVSSFDRTRVVGRFAQHTAGHQRKHHVHWNHDAAEGQYRYGCIRSSEIVGGYGQANTGVTHTAANGQYLEISDLGATLKQPTNQEQVNNCNNVLIAFDTIKLI